jgi:phosphohistidine phosphatase
MRRLLLLRHAKAERSGGRDQDRVLAERGRSDAVALGAYLARHGSIPDRALVSTATRTRQTWALLAAAFGGALPVTFDVRLYEALPLAILQAVTETAPEAATLLVVGHNPGMAELAGMLVASGDVETRERLGRGFPTSALATISFAAESWAGVHAQGGRLEHFITPESLAETAD